ncbi:MAG: restriction endonuclease subunit R [Acidobacteria bacterium 13_1_20CM_3_53_8]|nr:MAG: restriction endonuclease subunit R [Acidobacteria bacterium 13_1_20CM_3_53_8]
MEDDPASNEYTLVERPLIEQLKGLGWSYLEGDKFVPELTERESFRDVLLLGRLRAALRRINLDENEHEWLDDSRITQAVTELQRLEGYKLIERNEAATKLITRGADVEGTPERDDGRPRRIQFIDFDRTERNDFLAVNQFRVDTPGSQRYIVADLVLFVNGIPLVVVECKSPALTNPTEEAITQLLRYGNQRTRTSGSAIIGEETVEGAENLFYYNQLLVATCFFEARVGSISASYEHFLEWKDTYPRPSSEVAEKLCVKSLSSQQMLAAGMLRPEHLLDIVRNFTLFQEAGGKRIKIIPRYTQFRAVRKAVERLTTGKTRREDGERDQRGGIIWHTQGSGKSLTMVFLIRKMRRIERLRNFKIVIVTDRRDLQEQLSDTAVLTDEKPIVPGNVALLKRELREENPDLVFAMIQKMRPEGEDVRHEDGETDEEPDIEDLGILNPSESILLLIDEAHRSHASKLHAALMRALPNAAKIGFTGTPILMGARKRTEEIFGPFLDRYTIKQSEIDKATVPILYEGRSVEGRIADEQSLDFYFDNDFRDRSPQERAEIKRRFVNQPEVAKALKLIAAKANNMLRHYVSAMLPEGLKAQVVSSDREAAVRYQQAFDHAKVNLLSELRAIDPALLKGTNGDGEHADDKTKFLIHAYQYLPTIERLEFAAVISGTNNDPEQYRRWNNPEAHQRVISRFKRDLINKDPSKQDSLAFLCVASMLITGFDAPVEGVLYLDRSMKEHELLQTIARVNRPFTNKTHGLVMDYRGIAQNLKEALAVYTAEDVAGALSSIKDKLPLLVDRHRRACAVFEAREIRISNVQACVDLLADAEIRADFVLKLKKFLKSLNIVLPRPEALPYTADAKQLGLINRIAARLYRDEEINLTGVGEKVRRLIDEYVEAKGIRVEIPPVSITDPDFERAVDDYDSDRSKASEMEHAARYHISKHYQEDPVFYKKLSERLQEILQQFADNWAARVEALRELTREIARGRPPNEFGLDLKLEARFYDIIVEEASKEGVLTYERRAEFAKLTVEVVELIRQHLRRVDFWRNPFNREVLQKEVAILLDSYRAIQLTRCESVADRLVELAHQLSTYLKE